MKNEIYGYVVALVILVCAFVIYRLVVTGWFANVSTPTLLFFIVVIAGIAIGIRAFCKSKEKK